MELNWYLYLGRSKLFIKFLFFGSTDLLLGQNGHLFCFLIDSYDAMLIPIDLLYGYHPLWMSYEVVHEGCSAPQDFNLEGQNDNMM